MESRIRASGLEHVADQSTSVILCRDCKTRDKAACATLNGEQLERLEGIVSRVTLKPGDALVHEGDPTNEAYTVTSGAVKRYALLADGRRQILGFHFKGDFFDLPRDDESRATVEALTPSTFCRFSRGQLVALMEDCLPLQRGVQDKISEDLAEAQARILLLGRKTAVERVASFLIELNERAEEFHTADGRLVPPMSRHDIADYLGLTTETVSRAFTKLRKCGVIATSAEGSVTLLDKDRLTDIAECLDDMA